MKPAHQKHRHRLSLGEKWCLKAKPRGEKRQQQQRRSERDILVDQNLVRPHYQTPTGRLKKLIPLTPQDPTQKKWTPAWKQITILAWPSHRWQLHPDSGARKTKQEKLRQVRHDSAYTTTAASLRRCCEDAPRNIVIAASLQRHYEDAARKFAVAVSL